MITVNDFSQNLHLIRVFLDSNEGKWKETIGSLDQAGESDFQVFQPDCGLQVIMHPIESGNIPHSARGEI